jgi:hypothetical protein
MARAEITTLAGLRAAEAACTRCPLYRDATQVVPGEGPARAKVMFVGEQPGNDEDLAGKPFVGPAGRTSGPMPTRSNAAASGSTSSAPSSSPPWWSRWAPPRRAACSDARW